MGVAARYGKINMSGRWRWGGGVRVVGDKYHIAESGLPTFCTYLSVGEQEPSIYIYLELCNCVVNWHQLDAFSVAKYHRNSFVFLWRYEKYTRNISTVMYGQTIYFEIGLFRFCVFVECIVVFRGQ